MLDFKWNGLDELFGYWRVYGSVCTFFVLGVAFAGGGQDVNRSVTSSVHEIKAQPTADGRALGMSSLFEYLSGLGKEEVNEVNSSTVREIASLLDVDGDVGRFYASKTLAVLGCHSRVALLFSMMQLKRQNPLSPTGTLVLAPAVSPREEIEKAIKAIEGHQRANCLGAVGSPPGRLGR